MGKTLLTGGTGMIGFNIACKLVDRGRDVRALVRDPEQARRVLPGEISLVEGDVTDHTSIERAIDGCDVVYHAAGLPEQWLADTRTFHRVNVEGTRTMVETALAAGVKRFIYTSTIDVFAAAAGAEYDESLIDPLPKGTPYERSKQHADRLVVGALERGLPAVFLHPSALFGPGPTRSPGLNQFFSDLKAGDVPMLTPGGLPVVYAPDCAEGHVLAEEQAPVGARYILSESYWEISDAVRIIGDALGLTKIPRSMPLWTARAVSAMGETWATLSKRAPLIPKGQLHFLQWRARPSSARAQKELGWQPTPFKDALKETVALLGLV